LCVCVHPDPGDELFEADASHGKKLRDRALLARIGCRSARAEARSIARHVPTIVDREPSCPLKPRAAFAADWFKRLSAREGQSRLPRVRPSAAASSKSAARQPRVDAPHGTQPRSRLASVPLPIVVAEKSRTITIRTLPSQGSNEPLVVDVCGLLLRLTSEFFLDLGCPTPQKIGVDFVAVRSLS
jgi:hypothetical protein